MMRWADKIYFAEFVVVAIPAALAMVISILLLVGLATAEPKAALELLPLWIGGCAGTYALWSMYFRLYDGKHSLRFIELPLFCIGCGVLANAMPFFYAVPDFRKVDQVVFSMICLSPIFVSIHWVIALTCTHNKDGKILNSSFHTAPPAGE